MGGRGVQVTASMRRRLREGSRALTSGPVRAALASVDALPYSEDGGAAPLVGAASGADDPLAAEGAAPSVPAPPPSDVVAAVVDEVACALWRSGEWKDAYSHTYGSPFPAGFDPAACPPEPAPAPTPVPDSPAVEATPSPPSPTPTAPAPEGTPEPPMPTPMPTPTPDETMVPAPPVQGSEGPAAEPTAPSPEVPAPAPVPSPTEPAASPPPSPKPSASARTAACTARVVAAGVLGALLLVGSVLG